MSKQDNENKPAEAIVNESVIALFEMLSQQYGIRVERVCVDWIDVSTAKEMSNIIREINLETTMSK